MNLENVTLALQSKFTGKNSNTPFSSISPTDDSLTREFQSLFVLQIPKKIYSSVRLAPPFSPFSTPISSRHTGLSISNPAVVRPYVIPPNRLTGLKTYKHKSAIQFLSLISSHLPLSPQNPPKRKSNNIPQDQSGSSPHSPHPL